MPFRNRPIPTPCRATGTILPVSPVGLNPGGLAGDLYLPIKIGSGAPLIVVLHGCTQTAVDYASAAGWLELADRHGFGVLLPQQQRANNANLCFNWFEPGDIKHGVGEVASIKAMIDWSVTAHAFDKGQIFVTGLSAGAAMAGAMLASYPATFAGGGLIAGLPYGMATSVSGAFQQMQKGPRADNATLAAKIIGATDHAGPWPSVSVWHGDADRTVNSANGTSTASQWRTVHRVSDNMATIDECETYRRTRWQAGIQGPRVEHVEVHDMGHGTPIRASDAGGAGYAAPYVLDVGISSSANLLEFWGIGKGGTATDVTQTTGVVRRLEPVGVSPSQTNEKTASREQGVEKIINDALRAAGLLR